MPPKKKKGQPKDDEPDGTIKNMYEKIPAELLDKVENPNKHLHQLKLPFRMCVVAPSGSGKTNFLVNLFYHENLLKDVRDICYYDYNYS